MDDFSKGRIKTPFWSYNEISGMAVSLKPRKINKGRKIPILRLLDCNTQNHSKRLKSDTPQMNRLKHINTIQTEFSIIRPLDGFYRHVSITLFEDIGNKANLHKKWHGICSTFDIYNSTAVFLLYNMQCLQA